MIVCSESAVGRYQCKVSAFRPRMQRLSCCHSVLAPAMNGHLVMPSHLRSAVESCTWTATPSGTSVPNSLNTACGSRTCMTWGGLNVPSDSSHPVLLRLQ